MELRIQKLIGSLKFASITLLFNSCLTQNDAQIQKTSQSENINSLVKFGTVEEVENSPQALIVAFESIEDKNRIFIDLETNLVPIIEKKKIDPNSELYRFVFSPTVDIHEYKEWFKTLSGVRFVEHDGEIKL